MLRKKNVYTKGLQVPIKDKIVQFDASKNEYASSIMFLKSGKTQ